MAEKTRLIITADDYGFCDEVDKGIRDACRQGLVNSVAVLPNGYDSAGRLQKLREIQQAYEAENLSHADSRVNHLDIGCHFTITSGRALTEAARENKYLSKKGYFREYTKMRLPDIQDEDAIETLKDVLRKELMAQLAVFKDIVQVKHLSSHHDSLIFFRDYYAIFLEIAGINKIPVRSPNLIPYSRQEAYYGIIGTRNKGNLPKYWKKHYTEFRKSRLEQKEPDLVKGFQSPDYLFGGNYFTRTIAGGIWEEKPQERAADDKMKEHYPASNGYTTEQPLSLHGASVEICAHLIDPYNTIDFNHGGPNYTQKDHPHYYPGVSSSYFDGRAMEFRLLKKLKPRIHQDNTVEFTSWEALPVQS